MVRGTVTFLVLILLLRLVGQREAGGLGMTDLLVVVLVADAASAGLTGDSESIGDGLILVGTILAWSVILDAVTYRWPRVGRVIKAGAEPLIRDGELNRRVMRRELMNRDEVLSQLRLHGLTHEREVHRAYMSNPTAWSASCRGRTRRMRRPRGRPHRRWCEPRALPTRLRNTRRCRCNTSSRHDIVRV